MARVCDGGPVGRRVTTALGMEDPSLAAYKTLVRRIGRLPEHQQQAALDLLTLAQHQRRAAGLGVAAPQDTFHTYIMKVNPAFIFHRAHEVLISVLQRVVDTVLGATDHPIHDVIICMPARTGKSELTSRLLPGYLLHRDPSKWAALASYGATLAENLSKDARDNYERMGHTLSEDARSVQEWRTGFGGGCWAVGIGGGATGKGYHIGCLDDPFKDAQEGQSPARQLIVEEWWKSVWVQRANDESARRITTMTRWDLGDTVGRLMRQLRQGDGNPLHLVIMPGLYDPDVVRDVIKDVPPEMLTIEPDWRQPGEALAPKRWSREQLLKRKADLGSHWFEGMVQQNPKQKEGKLFKSAWFTSRILKTLPEGVYNWATGVDLAGTDKETNPNADFTYAVTGCRWGPTRFIFTHAINGQWSPGTRDRHLSNLSKAQHRTYGFGQVRWRVERETGIDAATRETDLASALVGVPVTWGNPMGSKANRWDTFRAQCEVGNVYFLQGAWLDEFLSQLFDVVGAKTDVDDGVDAATLCFGELLVPPLVFGASQRRQSGERSS